MHGHDYGEFDYASTALSTGQIPLGIAKVSANLPAGRLAKVRAKTRNYS